MRDINNNVSVVKTLNPATQNSNVSGFGVDLQGYEAAMAVVLSGVVTDGTHTPRLQESDDNATFTDVISDDLDGAFSNIAANAVQQVGYKGAKRYIRMAMTSSGATGALYGGLIVRGIPHHAPVS